MSDFIGYGRVGFVIESELFNEIEEGTLIPIVSNPIFKNVYENEEVS
jgi:hypothetical protein